METKAIKVFNFQQLNFLIKKLRESNYNYFTRDFELDMTIAHASQSCTKLGIIIEGEVRVENNTVNGNNTVITTLSKGQVFGEILLFSKNNKYPYTIVANCNTKILYIDKNCILDLLSVDNNLLEGFLEHIAESHYNLNQYVKLLSHKTIRQKIAYYIVSVLGVRDNSEILLKTSKKQLAEYFGVERPSFVRELKKLQDEGIIKFSRSYIIVKNIDYLMSLV